jgi:4-amino-4-deoxy-L-arabinose transferase-like glycosyltransferase
MRSEVDSWSRTIRLRAAAREHRLSILVVTISAVAILTGLRGVFAALVDLRPDEAYYWTWSKESTLSFFDHPPMVAWFIRLGTAWFGDTPFGVRAAGLLAIFGMQVLLADLVRRRTEGVLPMAFALLAPEATLLFGEMSALMLPDVALAFFLTALLWTLCRLDASRDPRWWLPAGAFGGAMLLSKYVCVLVIPAIVAFVLWPPRNRKWVLTVWPWLALLVALALFSPVLIWNAEHDWASLKYQFVRVSAENPFSLLSVSEFIGLQFALVGPVLFPVLLCGTLIFAVRGYRERQGVAALLAMAAGVPFAYLLWRSTSLRIGAHWSMLVWPPAIAATAMNIHHFLEHDGKFAQFALGATRAGMAIGVGLVLLVFGYNVSGIRAWFGKMDPIVQESGYDDVAAKVVATMRDIGATWIATTDYRTYAMLRWELRDRVPVVQINERSRFLGLSPPDLRLIEGQPGMEVDTRKSHEEAWSNTTAVRVKVGTVDRTFRGVTVDTIVLRKITGWTPDLTPPAGSPLYRWPNMASAPLAPSVAQTTRWFAQRRFADLLERASRRTVANEGSDVTAESASGRDRRPPGPRRLRNPATARPPSG